MDRLTYTSDMINGVSKHTSRIYYGYVSNLPCVIKTDPTNVKNIEYYDAAGRLIKSKVSNANGDPDWSKVSYQYDYVGNMISATDQSGHMTVAAYDKLNRKTSVTTDPTSFTDADGNKTTNTSRYNITTSQTYDFIGNVLTSIDANNNTSMNTYDLLSRLTQVSQSVTSDGILKNLLTKYNYGDNTNTETVKIDDDTSCKCVVNTVTDPNGGIKKTYLDALGRTVYENDCGNDGISTTNMAVIHQYNNAGQETLTTYKDGSTVGYTYDNRGQLKEKKFNGDVNNRNTYTYNSLGQIDVSTSYRHDSYIENSQTVQVYSKQVTSYAYDEYNQVHQVTQAVYTSNTTTFTNTTSNSILYGYDDSGRVTSVSYNLPKVNPSGTQLNTFNYADVYYYDAYGRLNQTKYDNDLSDQVAAKVVQDYNYNTNGSINYSRVYENCDQPCMGALYLYL